MSKCRSVTFLTTNTELLNCKFFCSIEQCNVCAAIGNAYSIKHTKDWTTKLQSFVIPVGFSPTDKLWAHMLEHVSLLWIISRILVQLQLSDSCQLGASERSTTAVPFHPKQKDNDVLVTYLKLCKQLWTSNFFYCFSTQYLPKVTGQHIKHDFALSLCMQKTSLEVAVMTVLK